MIDNTEKYSKRLGLIKKGNPTVDENFLITAANYFDKVCIHLGDLFTEGKVTDSKTKKLILDMMTVLFGHCGTAGELAGMLNALDKYVGE